MTYDEITLFRRFLQDKGMLNNYEVFYRNHRFEKIDLDTFLEDVDAKDAILLAFDLDGAPNSIFTAKYWQQLNEKWMKRLAEFHENGEMIAEMQIRCDHCGRMMPRSMFAYNPKGQLHKHCRECESGEWDRKRKEQEKADKEKEKAAKAMRQLEIEIAAKKAKLERLAAEQQAQIEAEAQEAIEAQEREEANLNKTTKVCDHCGKRKLRSEFDESGTSPDGLQSWCKKCQSAAANVSAESDFLYERRQKMEAMKAPDAEVEVKTAPRLGEHDATMHFKANEKRIAFNGILSAQIQQAGLTKCYLSTERDGRQFLVFNNSEGANVTQLSTRNSNLSQVCSSSICRQIAEKYRLTLGENYYLHVTKNLARQKDLINIEVKQVRTREEYAVIVANRESKQLIPGRDIPEWQEPEEKHDMPLIEFTETEQPAPKKLNVQMTVDTKNAQVGIPVSGRKPEDILQQLIDRGHLKEEDIATFLYNKGWKLQRPVVVTTHKKFKV